MRALSAERQSMQLRGVVLIGVVCALVLFTATALARPVLGSSQAALTAQVEVPALSVMEHISLYVGGHRTDDPLVSVNGGEAKSSNVHGIQIAGTRYYYRVTGHASFDPLSRATLAQSETVGVLHPGSDWEVVIYQEVGH